MTLPNELHPGFLASAGGSGDLGDPIDQSLRFNNAPSVRVAYLQDSDITIQGTSTFSGWIKISEEHGATKGPIFGASKDSTGGDNATALGLADDGRFYSRNTSGTQFWDNLFRDYSAWYHLVLQFDSSRNMTLFVNNEQQSSTKSPINVGSEIIIGRNRTGAADEAFQGYMAALYYVDGSILAPTSFGKYNEDGVWVPQDYSGSYGTNGFKLTFDSSQTNGIGHDSSGNGNHFTASGFDTGDVVVYSKDLTAGTSGSYQSTPSDRTGALTQPELGFDGSTATSGARTNSANVFIYWNPDPVITGVTKLRVYTNGTMDDLHINGSSVGFTDPTSGGAYRDISAHIPANDKITEIAFVQGSSGSITRLYAIEVNDEVLVDNPANDVDYNDTPTSNYSTINPLNSDAATISNANLKYVGRADGSGYLGVIGSQGASSGKLYWETIVDDVGVANYGIYIGVTPSSSRDSLASRAGAYTYRPDGQKQEGTGSSNPQSSYGDTYTTGDIISVALDMDNGAVYFAKNGVWQNSGDPTSGATKTGAAFSSFEGSYTSVSAGVYGATGSVNFGQMPFIYTPPSGYKALQTNNLPEPTIKDAKDHFESVIWAGNDTDDRNITTTNGFAPDLVWIKSRSSGNHGLFDTIRGATKRIMSNYANAEDTQANDLQAFNTDGFQVGTQARVNASGQNYVAWCWKAGGTPSVTYTVKVVSDSGNKYRFNDFGASAVTLDLEEGGTYVFDQSDSSNSGHPLRFSTTSNGSHGGGSEYTTGVVTEGTPGQAGAKTTITVAAGAPTLYYYCTAHSGMGGQANTNTTKGSSNFDGTIQSKVTANTDAGFSIVSYTGNLTAGATVGHGLNSAPECIIVKSRDSSANWEVKHVSLSSNDHMLKLNLTDAEEDLNSWNNTAPTNSVFSLGAANGTNKSGDDFIAYCWHSVENYCKIGRYEGNNSTDGTFVYLGFKPQLVIFKNIDTTGSWVMYDTARNTENPVDTRLTANTNNGEGTSASMHVDFLSNGFKHRNSDQDLNTSHTFVYMAWAQHPFGGQNVPPATAR